MAALSRLPSPPATKRGRLRPAPPTSRTQDIEVVTESQVLEIVDFLAGAEADPEILELSATDLSIDTEFVEDAGPAASIPAMEVAEQHTEEVQEHDDERAWAARIADAKADLAAPPSAVETAVAREPAMPVAATAPAPVPSERMRAVEALSTTAPWVSAADSMVGQVGSGRSVGVIVGVSAAVSAAIVAFAFAIGSRGAPPAAAEPPRVIAAAAVVEPVAVAPADDAMPIAAPVVLDNAKARKLAAIGHRQFKAGNRATAANLFEDALSANPRCRLAHEGLGMLALERKQYADAVEHLREAVKIEPRNGANRRALGDAYAGLGRGSKAEEQYAKARQYGSAAATAKHTGSGGGVSTANPF